jgi:hypothetical protein
MFKAIADPDKKRSSREKAEAVLGWWVETSPEPADLVLCNPCHVEELAGFAADAGLLVRGVSFVPPNVFYVGVDDPPQEVRLT